MVWCEELKSNINELLRQGLKAGLRTPQLHGHHTCSCIKKLMNNVSIIGPIGYKLAWKFIEILSKQGRSASLPQMTATRSLAYTNLYASAVIWTHNHIIGTKDDKMTRCQDTDILSAFVLWHYQYFRMPFIRWHVKMMSKLSVVMATLNATSNHGFLHTFVSASASAAASTW